MERVEAASEERFFYKGLEGLKGSPDKAYKRISLCQDLYCGEN